MRVFEYLICDVYSCLYVSGCVNEYGLLLICVFERNCLCGLAAVGVFQDMFMV